MICFNLTLMEQKSKAIQVLFDEWDGYELLDSGSGQKLERFGEYILVRDEPRAWWSQSLSQDAWDTAGAIYTYYGDGGKWTIKKSIPDEWLLTFENLTLKAKLTGMSKHVGVFPEQSHEWRWIAKKITEHSGKPINILSLFGYTGVASLICAAEGASVTHVEGSKPAIGWGRENQRLSGLENAHIRWILDDAALFVKREKRRGNKYDAIILDPPAFGRGPKGQVWKIEKDLLPLLKDCRELLTEKPLFIILTCYTIDASSLSLGNLLREMMKDFKGLVEVGELALKPKKSANILPMSLFATWES